MTTRIQISAGKVRSTTARVVAAALLSVGLVAATLAATAPATSAAAEPTAHKAAKPAPPAIVEQVDPKSVEALRRMSAYLQSLSAFELTSQTSLDLVLHDGQKVLVDGVARYKVRRPAGFVIDVESNMKTRRFFYDGKQFTIVAPKLGYFATVAAPPTNREALEVLWTRYRVALPLEDLFRWSDPSGARDVSLESGFRAGTAIVDGVETEQYVFREPGFDWQVWIQTGDQPLPRKIVIVDLSDPARPAYTARLTWNVTPTITADDFTFRPGKDAHLVHLGVVAPQGGRGGSRE